MATSSAFEDDDEASSSDVAVFICRVPTLRAITEEVPMLMPKAILVNTMTRGKVKVMAATCAVLSCPIKPISSTCTKMLDETPAIMGAVRRARETDTRP